VVLPDTSKPRPRTTSSRAEQRTPSTPAARSARLIPNARVSATAKQTVCSSMYQCTSSPAFQLFPLPSTLLIFPRFSTDNTNVNPTSPYTFYDASCPVEMPIRKRSPQLGITLGLPGGINISLGLGNSGISSACSCFITKGPASTTVTRTVSSGVTRTSTVVSTVTTTKPAAQ
jgi:hypothetical protein